MNWKEEFTKILDTYISKDPARVDFENEITAFIFIQLETLLNDISETKFKGLDGHLDENLLAIQKELKDKWLNN
jgi:hypothetical protein